MIDPGHPFSVPYKELIESFEERIREGVEQPDQTRFTFEIAVTSYELPRTAYAITRVSGLVGRDLIIFQPGIHFRFSNNRIIWLHPTEHPDEGNRMEVEYTYRERPAGLTDFNPGSVTGTLIRAVAREVKLLYEQMDQAYRRAFIDIASGVALDNVVALLGVMRNPAIKSSGNVTFFRNKSTNTNVTIEVNTRIADESGRAFVTTEQGEIEPVRTEFGFLSNGIIKVINRLAEVVGIWLREDDPENKPSFKTKDTAPDLPFGEDERTITLDEDPLPSGELRIRYKSKSVTIPIEATEPGPEGNVNAETIIIMPKPPPGVDGVVNESPIAGGQNAEPDDQLRERAKHALEQSGNATLNAIKFAVLDVDGVEGVEVVDFSIDENIPLGEVRVRFSGGDTNEVEKMVNQTRAAGILAKLEIINKVLISGTFYMIPEPTVPATAKENFLSKMVEAMETLAIGNPLSLRRLNALAYEVNGLADVAEAQLEYKKEDPNNPQGDVTDPFIIERTELIRPDKSNLSVKLLKSLKAERKDGTNLELNVWLEDENDTIVRFNNLSLDISVTLRALSTTALDQPPVRVGRFTATMNFVDTNIAVLTIEPAIHAPDFRPEEHNPEVQVSINAAAYPGLIPSEDTTVDFS